MRDREILFRGKRCDNGEWCYGYLIESHRSWNGLHPHKSWIFDSPFSNGGWIALMGRHAVIDNTVGQYTGVVDKNGKQVFEGDIIGYTETDTNETSVFGVVRWCSEGNFGINNHSYAGYNDDEAFSNVGYMLKHSRKLSVIGNVFDDPDLLKGGENE